MIFVYHYDVHDDDMNELSENLVGDLSTTRTHFFTK